MSAPLPAAHPARFKGYVEEGLVRHTAASRQRLSPATGVPPVRDRHVFARSPVAHRIGPSSGILCRTPFRSRASCDQRRILRNRVTPSSENGRQDRILGEVGTFERGHAKTCTRLLCRQQVPKHAISPIRAESLGHFLMPSSDQIDAARVCDRFTRTHPTYTCAGKRFGPTRPRLSATRYFRPDQTETRQ